MTKEEIKLKLTEMVFDSYRSIGLTPIDLDDKEHSDIEAINEKVNKLFLNISF